MPPVPQFMPKNRHNLLGIHLLDQCIKYNDSFVLPKPIEVGVRVA